MLSIDNPEAPERSDQAENVCSSEATGLGSIARCLAIWMQGLRGQWARFGCARQLREDSVEIRLQVEVVSGMYTRPVNGVFDMLRMPDVGIHDI